MVQAWGIPCTKAEAFVRAFFPNVPAHANGLISGGPKGYTCRGTADGLLKNRMYSANCTRLSPSAMFFWGPTGGKVG